MIHSWPDTLRSLAFHDCYDYISFWQLYHAGASCEHITSVEVGIPRCDDTFPVHSLIATFPKLRNLSLPAISAPPICHDDEEAKLKSNTLVRLIFTPSTALMPQKTPLKASFLKEYILAFPKLRKLELPESCIDLENDEEMTEFEKLEAIISSRVGPSEMYRFGIFFDPG